MNSKSTFSIDFIPRKIKQDKNFAIVFARVTVNGQTWETSTKERIELKNWNSKLEKVDGRSPECKAVNQSITDIRFRITEKYRALKDEGKAITAETVKDAYLGINAKSNGHSLMELISFHMKIEEPKLKSGTAKNYRATEKYLKNFIFHRVSRQDLYLYELDFQFMAEFENYIPNHPIKASDLCTGNGVAKHIERLKKMVPWAKNLNGCRQMHSRIFHLHGKKLYVRTSTP